MTKLLLTLLVGLMVAAAPEGPPQIRVIGGGIVRGGAPSAGGTPLTTGMVGYWPLDEGANVTAPDAHNINCGGSGCDLTDISSHTDSGTGIYSNARDFEQTEADNRLRILDNADTSITTAETSFAVWGWAKPEAALSSGTMISKWTSIGNQRAFFVDYNTGTSRWRFFVSNDGTATGSVSANNAGAATAGTWYFWLAEHDADTNQIHIRIGSGATLNARDTASWTTGVFDDTAGFRLGALANDTVFWDGLIDEVGYVKRVLSDCEEDFLFNGGAGRDYAAIAAFTGCV